METQDQNDAPLVSAASGCNDLLGGIAEKHKELMCWRTATFCGGADKKIDGMRMAIEELCGHAGGLNRLIEAMDERMEGEGLDRCPKCGTFAQVQRFVAGHPCQDVCIGCKVTPNA